ncbi:MAG TPA: zinc ribbon domain-containing protein [Xanthobacteraceae bacterium]
MPVYDYLCARCGPFTDLRPMADCDLPDPCPKCRKQAPRAFLTAPYLAAMSAEGRLAHATNERSASAPQLLSKAKDAHGAGCRCCSGRSPSKDGGRNGAKSFPANRPWMISH